MIIMSVRNSAKSSDLFTSSCQLIFVILFGIFPVLWLSYLCFRIISRVLLHGIASFFDGYKFDFSLSSFPVQIVISFLSLASTSHFLAEFCCNTRIAYAGIMSLSDSFYDSPVAGEATIICACVQFCTVIGRSSPQRNFLRLP